MSRHAAPRSTRGFTVLEMLVVIAILGVVSAVAIPTLLNSLDRGRQMRTMGDIRTVGLAVQAYVVDTNLYPQATNISDLGSVIGDYMPALPLRDGWDRPMVYSAAALGYTLGSAGKDGGSALNLIGDGGPTGDFDADIIYANGAFLQWPEGAQMD